MKYFPKKLLGHKIFRSIIYIYIIYIKIHICNNLVNCLIVFIGKMNKQTELLNTIRSVSSILKVLALLAAKNVFCIKRANNQNQLKQKPSVQREKQHLQRFNFSLLQTSQQQKMSQHLFDVSNQSRDSIAKFESLLRFFVSILENTLERKIPKAKACTAPFVKHLRN